MHHNCVQNEEVKLIRLEKAARRPFFAKERKFKSSQKLALHSDQHFVFFFFVFVFLFIFISSYRHHFSSKFFESECKNAALFKGHEVPSSRYSGKLDAQTKLPFGSLPILSFFPFTRKGTKNSIKSRHMKQQALDER